MTNNGVLAMSGANFAAEQADGRLDNAKVDALAVSPNLPPFVAVFTKQAKGQPAHVKVYRAPNLTEEVCQFIPLLGPPPRWVAPFAPRRLNENPRDPVQVGRVVFLQRHRR